MTIQKSNTGIHLWGIAGVLLAIGFLLHPELTAEGMQESIWVPDHAIILLSLILFSFGLGQLNFYLKKGDRHSHHLLLYPKGEI